MRLDRTFELQAKHILAQVKLDVIWIPKAIKQPVQQQVGEKRVSNVIWYRY